MNSPAAIDIDPAAIPAIPAAKTAEIELEELTSIYIDRGLNAPLARQVAETLTAHNAIESHMRDELGYFEHHRARPVQAAIASAVAFALGGLIPLIGLIEITNNRVVDVVMVSILGLIITGFFSAKAAGAGLLRPMVRVLLGGSLAMAVTFAVGSLFDLAG